MEETANPGGDDRAFKPCGLAKVWLIDNCLKIQKKTQSEQQGNMKPGRSSRKQD